MRLRWRLRAVMVAIVPVALALPVAIQTVRLRQAAARSDRLRAEAAVRRAKDLVRAAPGPDQPPAPPPAPDSATEPRPVPTANRGGDAKLVPSDDGEAPRIALEAESDKSEYRIGEDIRITVKIRNVSERKLLVNESELPWQYPWAIRLEDETKHFTFVRPMADIFFPRWVELGPDQQMEGRCNLKKYVRPGKRTRESSLLAIRSRAKLFMTVGVKYEEDEPIWQEFECLELGLSYGDPAP